MTEVAAAAGFSSIRRFNETFLTLFQRPPRALRRKAASKQRQENIVLRLTYRSHYDWEGMLAFLRARAISGVEVVDNDRYYRTVEVDGKVGSIAVMHSEKQQSLVVSIRFPTVQSLPAIVARVRRQFDLGADIETIDNIYPRTQRWRDWLRSGRVCGLREDGMDLRSRCAQCWDSRLPCAPRAVWQMSWFRRMAGRFLLLSGFTLR